MKTFVRTTLLVLCVLTTPLATAGTRDPVINNRQDRQAARIDEGVASGELNRREARRLHRKEREIKAKEHVYKADGTLTHAERRDLKTDLNTLSKDIKNEKHDIQRR